MITAVPMDSEQVAAHFSKASSIMFFNEQGKAIGSKDNPAQRKNCHGKAELMKLLSDFGVERVLVRNIGEKMLERLLKLPVSVFHLHTGRVDLTEVVKGCSLLTPLIHASQGRPSPNAADKQGEGGHCCGHHDHLAEQQEGSCCGGKAHAAGSCHDHDHGHGHQHGEAHGRSQCHGGKQRGAGKCCHS